MRGRRTEQITLRAPPTRNLKKLRFDSVMNYLGGHPVVLLQIVTRSARNSNQPARAPHRRPQEKLPERQVEPAEVFRVPFVLQIVKHSNHRRAANVWSGKSRIEQYVDALFCDRKRKAELLP